MGAGGDGQAQVAVELVDGAIGLQAEVVLGDAGTIEEGRGALVALLGVASSRGGPPVMAGAALMAQRKLSVHFL